MKINIHGKLKSLSKSAKPGIWKRSQRNLPFHLESWDQSRLEPRPSELATHQKIPRGKKALINRSVESANIRVMSWGVPSVVGTGKRDLGAEETAQ